MESDNPQENNQEIKWFNAVRTNDLNSMKKLVKKGIDIRVQDEKGNTALILASKNGNLGMVKWIIDCAIDKKLIKTLLLAYKNQQPLSNKQISQLYEKIFEMYSVIDIPKFSKRYTAIQIAAKYGHMDIVQYLLTQGADINKEQRGIIPLLLASSQEHKSIMEYWIEKCNDVDEEINISIASETNYKNFIKHLIEHGVDINEETPSGVNPLLFAVGQGYKDTVKYLLENGADVNKLNKYGETPLMIALLCNHENLVKYLVEHGANVNKGNRSNNLPLLISSRVGQLDLVKYLVEHGAEVNLWGDFSEALQSASREGHIKVVQYLIEKGAAVNRAYYGENPPLIKAITGGHEDVVKYLTEHGAEVNLQIGRTTPLIRA